ncbi:6064c393-8025-4ce1-8959-3ea41a497619 [Thermothielavioides terrestris]|uniref:6064c393-8025-4ce1-8959-3ea41a497619 n=1 Tax=Thermothielavioides terrestris TaxID=2587410 RepID=A0A3S4EZ00_9PEZI|nr:6064c393-8025-4ce1-8959-3ea41a497619 [Thermothielavioides terrestris]
MSGNPRAKRNLRPGDLSMPAKRKREASTADDLFSDDVWGDPEVVDLVDKDEVPPEILSNSQEEATKNYVKLSAFDCAICMDNVTDLTVTHCGHLFCSECLHAALNMNPAKRVCPICRQKIDPVPASGKFSQRAKGFYPLELKLMTKKTLGKKPERQAT